MIYKFIFIGLSLFCFVFSLWMFNHKSDLDNLMFARKKSDIIANLDLYQKKKYPLTSRFYNHKNIQYLISNKYWRIGEKDKAISVMNQSIQEHPYDRNSWNKLGDMYSSQLDYKNAARSYLRALELYEEDVNSSIGLAKSSIIFNDEILFNKALENYQNKLYPFFESYYTDDAMDKKTSQKFWRYTCGQIDSFQSLSQEWDTKNK